jgi:hypothetical protein
VKHALRRRFMKVYRWYQYLLNQVDKHIAETIESARIRGMRQACYTIAIGLTKAVNSAILEEPTDESTDLNRPSEYLRRQCPLCFGGADMANSTIRYDQISIQITVSVSNLGSETIS